MPKTERPEPLFIGSAAGLDFLNSIATPVDTPVEWLASGEDLLAWLEAAHLLPVSAAVAMRNSALPGELDAVAAQARALREWFRGFVRTHMGRSLRPSALRELDTLNQLLARNETFTQIVHTTRFERHVERRWRSADSLLLPIGDALADLVCTEDFADIKACEGAGCSLLYLDQTRARARRWCSMSVCGNRSKQAAHRKARASRR